MNNTTHYWETDMRHMKTPALKNTVFLQIGACHAACGAAVLKTTLGSCVAVCMFDPVKKIGGMNHILLPESKTEDDPEKTSTRYGVNAMDSLIERMLELGGDRRRFVAKVFGGASTIPWLPEKYSAGRQNMTFVLGYLKEKAIPVISQDLGGKKSRRISCHTDSGEVFVQRISDSADSANDRAVE